MIADINEMADMTDWRTDMEDLVNMADIDDLANMADMADMDDMADITDMFNMTEIADMATVDVWSLQEWEVYQNALKLVSLSLWILFSPRSGESSNTESPELVVYLPSTQNKRYIKL